MCLRCFRNKMTTDYRNMSYFEAGAVFMIAVGIALIGFQFYVALPDETRTAINSSMDVFNLTEAWETEKMVYGTFIGGLTDFYDEFYVASAQIMEPVVARAQTDYQTFATAFSSTYDAIAALSEDLAANYSYSYENNSFTMPGVEAGAGGKVMGEYFERLTDQFIKK